MDDDCYSLLTRRGVSVYLVGGAVRDKLLGLPVRERDWVVVGTNADTMLDLKFIPVGKFFPVFLHPDTKEEFALARTEKKIAKGYHGFDFCTDSSVTLEQDLRRRDLTVNAIALDSEGEIIDPFGGVADLQKRRLRHVSTAFCEDPVRTLRLARFLARFYTMGFRVSPSSKNLLTIMQKNGELDALVPERVAAEMTKALSEKNPSQFFDLLIETDCLNTIMPQMTQLLADKSTRAFVFDKLDGYPSRQTDDRVDGSDSVPPAAPGAIQPHIRFAIAAYFARLRGSSLLPLCALLKLPDHWRRIVALVERNLTDLADGNAFDESQWLDLLIRIDALRNPLLAKNFIAICLHCDQKKFTTPAATAHQLMETLRQTDKKAAIAQYCSDGGSDIKNFVRHLHLQAIKNQLHSTQ